MNQLLAAGLIIYIIILELRIAGLAFYIKNLEGHMLHHDDIIHEINNKLYGEK